MSDLVWYAAYGSNLSTNRFLTYLNGGPVPHSPAGRVQAGARDRSPPLDSRPLVLPHPLLFARSSAGWGGGGVAFLGADPVGATTLGRAWLITRNQFADVAGQENGQALSLDLDAVDLSALKPASLEVCDGWYGRVLLLGPGPDGHPLVTITCPSADELARRPAHASYLRVIGIGLMETWLLSPAAAARYLADRDGNQGIDAEALAGDLADWDR
jgi:hypothetical protein